MTALPPTDGKKSDAPAPDGHNPWSPPPAGSTPVPSAVHPADYPAPYPMAPMPAQARNGMGTAALVLGIIGVGLGTFVILFWLSWLPALLAVVFGCLGLGQARKGLATNRGMALAGVILGGAGLLIAVAGGVLSVVLVKEVADELHSKVEVVKVPASEEARAQAEAESAEEKARNLKFDEPYTFENGLTVTVVKPEPFTPDEFAHGHAEGNKAVQVTVKVVNTGTERAEVESGLPYVSDADGAAAELVIDGSGRQKVITGHVLPGKEAVGKYAFSLPPDAADRIEVGFTPDAERWGYAYWNGSTGS